MAELCIGPTSRLGVGKSGEPFGDDWHPVVHVGGEEEPQNSFDVACRDCRCGKLFPAVGVLEEGFESVARRVAGGLLIGLLVSYGLLRFYDRIPTASPVTKAVILCVLVLIMATVALGLPATRATSGDAWRYFLIGTLINLVRILALGVAVGWLY